MVEQVNDLLEQLPRPNDTVEEDLHLTRAIFGKWSADILLVLHRTPTAGFEDLRRSLGGISARVLSIKLKDLEDIGVVTREIVDARPPRVRYSLTERGWTVAWLAQPIVLFIRLADRQSPPHGATTVPYDPSAFSNSGTGRPAAAPPARRRAVGP